MYGQRDLKSKLLNEKIINQGKPHKEIAEIYNIHISTVSSIGLRTNWRHL